MKRNRFDLTHRSVAAPGGGNDSPLHRWISWWRSKHPVVRFVALLVVLLGLWQWTLSSAVAQRTVFEPHLRLYARLCGFVLRLLGEPGVRVTGLEVKSDRFWIEVVEGCDAIQPVGLFVAAVLASPVAWRPKIPGLLVGSLFLMIMNLVRIVILFYVGVYYRTAFDWAHRDVSQGLFIVLVVLTWVLWALWAVRRTPLPPPPLPRESDAVPVPA